VVLGFEVRVELTNAGNGGPFTAQITRGDAEALALREGDTVYVRATRVPSIADDVTGPRTLPPIAGEVTGPRTGHADRVPSAT